MSNDRRIDEGDTASHQEVESLRADVETLKSDNEMLKSELKQRPTKAQILLVGLSIVFAGLTPTAVLVASILNLAAAKLT